MNKFIDNKISVEFNDKIAFHPGYYIKEIIEDSGLTQEDFAKRLGTTPKNISILIRGEQSLSVDMGMKLARMTGIGVESWLNLQVAYDTLIAEYKALLEFEKEKEVFKDLDYKYFKDHFQLEPLYRKVDKQVEKVGEFLNVASLTVLTKQDFAINFKTSNSKLTQANIVKANAMTQIAINEALKVDSPKFNQVKFNEAIEQALSLTTLENPVTRLYDILLQAGVVLTVLPNIPGSKTNGATKKVGNKIMLMVNDRYMKSDTFWFTLFHEIGHIVNGDFGISYEEDAGIKEEKADQFARDTLIPANEYQQFIGKHCFNLKSVISFANKINRDGAIVLGRLQRDGYISYTDTTYNSLKRKYKI